MKARSFGTSQSVAASASRRDDQQGKAKGRQRLEAEGGRSAEQQQHAVRAGRRECRAVDPWSPPGTGDRGTSRQRDSSVARARADIGRERLAGRAEAQPHPGDDRQGEHAQQEAGWSTSVRPWDGLHPWTGGPCLLRIVELLLEGVVHGGCGMRLVALERALPGGDGVVGAAGLDVGVGQVVEDDRVLLGQRDRPLQLLERIGVATLLVVGPAQAVDEVAVLGIEVERAA